MSADFTGSTLEDMLKLLAKASDSHYSKSIRPKEIIMSDVAVDMVMRGEIDPPEGMRWVDAKETN